MINDADDDKSIEDEIKELMTGQAMDGVPAADDAPLPPEDGDIEAESGQAVPDEDEAEGVDGGDETDA